MELMEIYNNLLNAWTKTHIDEQEEIEIALDEIIGKLNKQPKKIKELSKELNRFHHFMDNQTKIDNIISLLKICNKLDTTFNNEIDVNTCDINKLENQIIKQIHNECYIQKEYEELNKSLTCMWKTINKYELQMEDSYVFKNSNVSVADIRTYIPCFDIYALEE